jgi:predicted amidohydrolase
MEKYLAAAIQLDSQQNKRENLKAIGELIDEAASKNAKIIGLPETITYIGVDEEVKDNAELIGGETTQLLCEKAKKYNVWLHGGSFFELVEGQDKVYNTTLLINPKGEIVAIYRKLHLFDVEIDSGHSIKESNIYLPGEEIVVAKTDLGNIGLSICYDIRFPEIYRIMALMKAQVIFAPASFTLFTGRDHWEPILRARAIENGCYIIAPSQIGKKAMVQTNGKTMIIDPWGNVIAKASDYPSVILAEIDLQYVNSVRKQIPVLKNRRLEIYSKYTV